MKLVRVRLIESAALRVAGPLVYLAVVAAGAAHPARGEDGESAARERLALMQAAIADLRATSEESSAPAALELTPKPLLRYSDPTRDLMDPAASVLADAGVWRVGRNGRPTALVVLEIYRPAEGSARLAYEFVSLTDAKFTMQSRSHAQVGWEATATDMKLLPLPDAPQSAASAAARLSQMRQLARRFTVREEFSGGVIECRLMPQPIDRYASPDGKSLAGAVFAFANGTNPEAGLLLEYDGERWSYGVFRLGAAGLTVGLDDGRVATLPPFGEYGRRDGAYTSTSRAIDLPE